MGGGRLFRDFMMKQGAKAIGLMVLGTAAVANAEECDKVKFSDGRLIVMRAAFVEARDAMMEWPWGTKVFSVSIRPPVGDQFSDVFSIIVEPNSEFSSMRSQVCAEDSGERSCSSYSTPAGASVAIYFKNREIASRDALVQEVREYVDKRVLVCP